MNLLQSLGLADRADHLPATLSGGQRQRVAIARALAMDPELLLFDEPTAALDPELVGEVHTMLRNLAQQGATMVIVTHEIGFARNVADRAIFLDHGRIIADGPAAQVFGGASDPRLAAFLSFSHR
jgi:polar amino acid transport system ATP-binding protein